MKRIRILSLLPVLALASCSKTSYGGTYQFRLGKTDGSHLEVTAVLSNEKYNDEGMKKMTLSADLGEEMSPTSIIEKYGEEYPIIEPFIDIIVDEVKDVNEIPLYYKVLDNKATKYGKRLAVGTDFVATKIKEVKEKYEAIKDILDGLGVSDEDLIITPELTKYFFGAYINSKTLTFEIPVSLEDLKMQSFWYGKSTLILGDYVDKLPGTKGEERFGTHPVIKKDDKGNVITNECEEVNKLFEKEFSNTHLYTTADGMIGSFVVEEIDGQKTLKCYLDDTYTGSRTNIEGYVYVNDGFGHFDAKKDIKISVDENNKTSVTYKNETGKDQIFIDENGKEFKFVETIQTPFVFRDFHTVNLGLTKI